MGRYSCRVGYAHRAVHDFVTWEHHSLQDPDLLRCRSGYGSAPATVKFLWGVGQQRDPCAKLDCNLQVGGDHQCAVAVRRL